MDLDCISASPVYFADVLPGSGKTYWAINKMRNCLQNNTEIILYVAPTRKLIVEVCSAITGINDSKVSAVYSRDELEEEITDIPASARSAQRTVASSVQLILEGGINEFGDKVEPATSGSVVLCTHDTFLALHNFNISRRRDVTVIFDEARKCILREQNFKLPTEAYLKILTKFLNLSPLPGNSDNYHYGFIKSSVNTEEFFSIFGKTTKSRSSYEKLYTQFKEAEDRGVQLFLRTKRPDPKFSQHSLILQTILVPYRIFTGWKRTILLSAFFRDSQMYHLLKRHDVSDLDNSGVKGKRQRVMRAVQASGGEGGVIRLIDISDKVVPAKRYQQIISRYADLSITYLSPSESFTMGHLKKGVMIDPTKFDRLAFNRAFRDWTKNQNVAFSLRRALSLKLQNNLPEGLAKVLSLLPTTPESKLTPLRYYLKWALQLSAAWYKKTKQKQKALPITTNVGLSGAKSYWNKDVLKTIPDERLVVKMPFRSQGLNSYSQYDTLAFLATLNPRPATVSLMRQLCPSYDPSLDHTVDQAAQTAMRISTRDVKSKSKTLIIVTDKILAQFLANKLKGSPKVIAPQKLIPDIPLLDPFVVVMESAKDRFMREQLNPDIRQRNRANSRKSMKKKRASPDYIRFQLFLKNNSAYSGRVASLRSHISILKKAGKDFSEKQAELAELQPKLKQELVDLKLRFQTENQRITL